MTTPALQREFDRLWRTPNRMLTEREIHVLFDGGQEAPMPPLFWIIVAGLTLLAALPPLAYWLYVL